MTAALQSPGKAGNTVVMMGSMRTANLVITTAAAGAVNGAALTTQPVITITDRFGNTLTGRTDVVTCEVHLGDGTPTTNATATAVAGVATFSGLIVDSPTGTSCQLRYRIPGAQGAYHVIQDAAITPTVGAAASAAITRAPVGAVSGAVLGTQPVVTLYDTAGRVATGSTINVVASKFSGTGTLSGSSITTAAVAGVATFTNLVMTTAGTYVLAFTPTSLTAVNSGTLTTS